MAGHDGVYTSWQFSTNSQGPVTTVNAILMSCGHQETPHSAGKWS